MYARVAQLVEHTTDTGGVLGSNPSTRTMKNKILYTVIFLLVVIVFLLIGSIHYISFVNKQSVVNEIATTTTDLIQISKTNIVEQTPQVHKSGESFSEVIDSQQKFFRIRNVAPTYDGITASTTNIQGKYSYLFEEKRDQNISNIVGYFAHGAFAWSVPNWLANNWVMGKYGSEGMKFTPKVRENYDDFSDIIYDVSTSTESNNAENIYLTMINDIPKNEMIISEIILNKATKDMISIQMENSTRIYHIAAYTGDFKHITDLYFMDGNGKTLDLRFEASVTAYPQFSDKIRDMVEGIGELKLPQG